MAENKLNTNDNNNNSSGNTVSDQLNSTINQTTSNVSVTSDKKKLRPCCACPMTKKIRDECIFEKGEDLCIDAIRKHNICLKDLGFIVDESI